MSSNLALKTEPAPLVACTVCRDIQDFDLLIEDMEAALGEGWGDLSFEEALAFFDQPEAADLEFIAVAVDAEDAGKIGEVHTLIQSAKEAGIKVVLIAEDLNPLILHELLRAGTDDFVPYPLPEGALAETIDRVRYNAPVKEIIAEQDTLVLSEPVVEPPQAAAAAPKPATDGQAIVLACHGVAGGVGSTTFAINLAWEIAKGRKDKKLRVGILDLDLQFGTVSTYLDMQREDQIYEILADTVSMDNEPFRQSLQTYEDTIEVFTSPADMLPLDLIEPENIDALLTLCKDEFDVVIIDMPTTLVQWTETVLQRADIYYAVMGLDLRSAQNALRFVKALKSEDLPLEKVNWVLNRAPKPRDSGGQARVKRMAESLGVTFAQTLPDGGQQVQDVNDEGGLLSEKAPKNPLRKEIAAMADTLLTVMEGDADDVKAAANKKKRKSLFSFSFGK